MKRPVILYLALASLVLATAFLVWAFAQHGTIGLVHVNSTFKMAFTAFGAVAVIAPLIAWLAASLRTTSKRGVGAAVAVLAVILSLPGLLGVPAAFVVLGGLTETSIGDTPPQLFITSRTGAHGLPDLAVTFNTAEASKHILAWGKVLGADSGSNIEEPSASREHAFVLRDLEPDTAYYYNVSGTGARVFHTAGVGPLRFAVGADSHFGSSDQKAVLTEQMLSQIALPENGYDYFFMAGDMVNWGFSKGMWQEAFTTLSRATSTIPFRIAAGNHDTMFSGFGNYLHYASPEDLPAGSGNRLWTRIDSGSIHFFIIDLEWSAEAFTDKQAAWLEAELNTIPQTEWKIVIGHGFTYASGGNFEGWPWYDNPETIEKLVPIFERAGVDLVFSGHNHQMEVLQKSDVTYILASPFGRSPDPERIYSSPFSVWYGRESPGFADVTIDGDNASIVFRAPDFHEIYRFNLTLS